MVEMGILDPTKVTRLAPLNAASVAGLLLTTQVMTAGWPTEDEHAHGAPGASAAWACNTGFAGYSQKSVGPRSFFGFLLIYVPDVPVGNAENYRVRV